MVSEISVAKCGWPRMSSDIAKSVSEMEEMAFQLMINDQVKPKDAMRISGCNYPIGGKKYRRIYQRVHRKRQLKQLSQKVSKIKRLEGQLDQHKKKQASIQQYKREAGNAIVEKNAVEKRLEEVSSALQASRRRYYVLTHNKTKHSSYYKCFEK